MRLKVGFLLLGLVAALGVEAAEAPTDPSPLMQCQSLLRVRQDASTHTEQLAAMLLARAEKAEQELAAVKQQLKDKE